MTNRKFNLGLVQLCSGTDYNHNIKQAETLVRKAVDKGAQLVALPENVCYIGTEGSFLSLACDGRTKKALNFFQNLAAELGVFLVAGAIPFLAERSPKAYNRCCVISDTGEILYEYNKIHLFNINLNKELVYEESKFLEGGDPQALRVIDLPFVKLGVLVCFDLRFPEAFRVLADLGAELILVPSAFTHMTGSYHWETLLKARALDNQLFVAAPNQCGEHLPGRKSWGHSMIVSPWGVVTGECEEEDDILVKEIDLSLIAEIRRNLPVRSARRINLSFK